MIRSHFGLQRNPFDSEAVNLLAHQQEIFDILRVHAQQGGLCLVLGEPGTGKSVLKQALLNHDPKRLITPVVNRTLHTYHNTLRILCEAFQIEFEGRDHRCERLLVQEAFKIHRAGKLLVPIIDDAHLMPSECLRKLRLLCEDFPHSHNLVLIGQPPLLQSLALSVNEEIRSRITYSVVLPRLAPETLTAFILGQLDRASLGQFVGKMRQRLARPNALKARTALRLALAISANPHTPKWFANVLLGDTNHTPGHTSKSFPHRVA